jgi:hypothetical protein
VRFFGKRSLIRATYTFFKTSGQNDLDSIIEQIKLKEQAE